MKHLFVLSILLGHLLSGELFFTPFEAKDAQNRLIRWIELSRSSIDIAIYSFTNRTIAKALKNAAKRGVAVRIVCDAKEAIKRYSQIGYLAKYRNIKVFTLRGKYSKRGEFYGKMHMKLAIFDNKRLIFGSANWTYSAFRRNYEVIYFLQDYAQAKKAKRYFEALVRKAQEY